MITEQDINEFMEENFTEPYDPELKIIILNAMLVGATIVLERIQRKNEGQ